jgi:hypothetical protein
MVFGNGAFGLVLQILRTPLRFIDGQQALYLHVSLCLVILLYCVHCTHCSTSYLLRYPLYPLTIYFHEYAISLPSNRYTVRDIWYILYSFICFTDLAFTISGQHAERYRLFLLNS